MFLLEGKTFRSDVVFGATVWLHLKTPERYVYGDKSCVNCEATKTWTQNAVKARFEILTYHLAVDQLLETSRRCLTQVKFLGSFDTRRTPLTF